MKPARIQLSRTKGWRMPPDTVKVTRAFEFPDHVHFPFRDASNG